MSKFFVIEYFVNGIVVVCLFQMESIFQSPVSLNLVSIVLVFKGFVQKILVRKSSVRELCFFGCELDLDCIGGKSGTEQNFERPSQRRNSEGQGLACHPSIFVNSLPR